MSNSDDDWDDMPIIEVGDGYVSLGQKHLDSLKEELRKIDDHLWDNHHNGRPHEPEILARSSAIQRELNAARPPEKPQPTVEHIAGRGRQKVLWKRSSALPQGEVAARKYYRWMHPDEYEKARSDGHFHYGAYVNAGKPDNSYSGEDYGGDAAQGAKLLVQFPHLENTYENRGQGLPTYAWAKGNVPFHVGRVIGAGSPELAIKYQTRHLDVSAKTEREQWNPNIGNQFRGN